MRAILLAAGLGTRLRPLTNTVPKCLITIKGTPLLEIWINKLLNAGIESILVNTHHHADKVATFLTNSNYRNRIVVVYEPQLLGTAGTLLTNLPFFQGDDGILAHADNYFLEDLSNLLARIKCARWVAKSQCSPFGVRPLNLWNCGSRQTWRGNKFSRKGWGAARKLGERGIVPAV